jgi:beta-glucosidase
LSIAIRVDERPAAPVALELKCGPGCSAKYDVTARLAALAGTGWTTLVVPLRCLPGADLRHVTAPFALSTSGRMRLSLSSIALVPTKGAVACS